MLSKQFFLHVGMELSDQQIFCAIIRSLHELWSNPYNCSCISDTQLPEILGISISITEDLFYSIF